MSDSKLSLQEILSNAGALQCLLHTICKAPSKTDYEFEAKYDVYERLMSTYTWWGYGGQMLTLTGFSLYCLRGYNTKAKLIGGALYFYWINHIFTLSAFAGVTTKLPWALETLNIDEKFETGKQIRIMNAIIRNRKNDSDNQVNSEFYKAICKTELLDSNIVQNDFFVKNQQYIPQIEPTQNTLPYLDAFITRYNGKLYGNLIMKYIVFLIIAALAIKNKKPVGFDKYIYCNACQAIVRNMLKQLNGSKSEIDVSDSSSQIVSASTDICKSDFKGYAFEQRSIKLGCQVFMADWADDLEEHLQKRCDDFESDFCVQYTLACKDVDPLTIQEERKQAHREGRAVLINGKTVVPNIDGHLHQSDL